MTCWQTLKIKVVFQEAWYALKGFEFPNRPVFLVEPFGLPQRVVFLKARRGVQNRVYSFKPFVRGLHQFCRTDVTTFKQCTQCSGIVQAQCVQPLQGRAGFEADGDRSRGCSSCTMRITC